ncbi:methionyl-tRNA formyltransferase [Patescibacteria group bacterium]|nr:methionyl-tRNA formyltransferase [Patescibacteria group bacterium]
MTKNNFKIIFIGTSEFAVSALKALIKNNYDIKAVITSPDKPMGRKQEITPTPIKRVAKEYNLPILQPEKILDIKSEITNLKPDLIIVSSYGKIIPKSILDIPLLECLNIHPSLLPKYRGSSPIQTAILNGDKTTGITIMLMDEKMDHGPIVSQMKIDIEPSENYKDLEKRLSQESGSFLIKILPQYLNNKIKPQIQNESEASYTKILSREQGEIDLNKSAKEIERMIKAFYPWPGTWFYLNKKRIKIIKAKTSIKKQETSIKTGKDFLILELVQPEGKKTMTGEEFFRGYKKQLDLKKII